SEQAFLIKSSILPQDDSSRFSVNGLHVKAAAHGDLGAPALTDGIGMDPLVPSPHPAFFIDTSPAGRHLVRGKTLDELARLAIRDEADLLALRLVLGLEPMFAGDLSHLGLSHGAYRKENARKFFF